MNTMKNMLGADTITPEEWCVLGLRACGFDAYEAINMLDAVKLSAQRVVERPAEPSTGGRRSGPRPRWTRSDDAKLRRMYHDGQQAEQIATELGRSLSAIYGRAYRLDLTRRQR